MSRLFPFVAHVHTLRQVRRTDWTGSKNRHCATVSLAEFERAGVLSSLSVCPDDDALRVDAEIRAAQFPAAFTFTREGRPQLFGQTVGWFAGDRLVEGDTDFRLQRTSRVTEPAQVVRVAHLRYFVQCPYFYYTF